MRGLVLVAAAVLAAGAAAAEETCAEAGLINDLAGAIVDGRAALPGLQQRRHGAEAAYLSLHYGGMEEGAARLLLEDLAGQGVPEAREALAVLVIAREGVEAGLRVIGPDAVRAFAEATVPVRRAVLAADGGQSYFRLMAAAEADPALMSLVGDDLAGGGEITALVAAMDDAAVAAVVDAAEAAGHRRVALVLAAGLRDRTRHAALVARHPGLDAGFTRMEAMVARMRNDLGPLPGEDVARVAREARVQALMAAAWQGLPAEFLIAALNQTGLEAEVAAVAVAYRAEVAAGRIDPLRDPEAAWLMQYRGLALAIGAEAAQGALAGIDFPPVRVRHYGGGAVESLDVMLAVETLEPVVRGAAAAMPERPPLLSEGFDWELWRGVAEALAAGTWAGAAPEIAVELRAGAGDWAGAVEAAGLMPPEARMRVWRDLIQRLDRGCGAWMAWPGQALGEGVMWRY